MYYIYIYIYIHTFIFIYTHLYWHIYQTKNCFTVVSELIWGVCTSASTLNLTNNCDDDLLMSNSLLLYVHFHTEKTEQLKCPTPFRIISHPQLTDSTHPSLPNGSRAFISLGDSGTRPLFVWLTLWESQWAVDRWPILWQIPKTVILVWHSTLDHGALPLSPGLSLSYTPCLSSYHTDNIKCPYIFFVWKNYKHWFETKKGWEYAFN